MAFDANLILKGLYGGVLISVDESDIEAVSKTVNNDGNFVVDISKTGKGGLAAVVVLTQPESEIGVAPYTDELVVEIQASDELDRNWETVLTFPTMWTYLRTLKKCTATVAFVAGDVGAVLDATTDPAVGVIRFFDEALKVVGGVGDIIIEMQSSADVYATAGDTLASAVTGVATQGAAAIVGPHMFPGVYVGRFVTDKKYVRSKFTSADDIGKCWCLLTDGAFQTL